MNQPSLFEEYKCEICETWHLEVDDLLLCNSCRKAYDVGYAKGKSTHLAGHSGFAEGFGEGRNN